MLTHSFSSIYYRTICFLHDIGISLQVEEFDRETREKVLTTQQKYIKIIIVPTIRIDSKTGFAYIPKDIRKEGYEGDVDTIANALTLTFIKPGVSMESAIKSLKIVLKDLELRIEHRKSTRQNNASKEPI